MKMRNAPRMGITIAKTKGAGALNKNTVTWLT